MVVRWGNAEYCSNAAQPESTQSRNAVNPQAGRRPTPLGRSMWGMGVPFQHQDSDSVATQ